MWEGIEAGQGLPYDMSWVTEGIKNHTLIWGTDGSYNREKGNQPVRSRLDYLLYQNRVPPNRHILGTVQFGKLVQSRNARALCTAPSGTGGCRVL